MKYILFQHVFLLCMLISYIFAICIVYNAYDYKNQTISNILCNPKCSNVKIIMIIMIIFTLFYELFRMDIISLVSIIILIIGIYGVLCYDEKSKLHVYFAFIVLLSMLYFTYYHSFYCKLSSNNLLRYLFFIQLVFVVFMIINYLYIDKWLLINELCILIIFAIYYLYLHYLNCIS